MADDTDAMGQLQSELAAINKRLDDMEALNKEQHSLDQDGKPWYASRAIWGSLVAFVAGVYSMVTSHVITSEDQSVLTTHAYNLVNAIADMAIVIGAFVAWWGRWKATERISNKPLP